MRLIKSDESIKNKNKNKFIKEEHRYCVQKKDDYVV